MCPMPRSYSPIIQFRPYSTSFPIRSLKKIKKVKTRVQNSHVSLCSTFLTSPSLRGSPPCKEECLNRPLPHEGFRADV